MSDPVTDLPLAADFPAPSHDAWLALVAKVLKGREFERLTTTTADGIRIAPLYTRADEIAQAIAAWPDAPPFARGTAQRPRGGWDVRQFHSWADPHAANAAILEDIEGGASSIALHIAAPGNSGMSIDNDALDAALDRVPLDTCPVALVADSRAIEAAAALEQVWDRRGISKGARLGHFNADPLGELAQSGILADPLDKCLVRAAELVRASLDMPGVTALEVDGHAYHSAGASEAQELAAMLSTSLAYLRACEQAGLPPERALPKIAITLAADADQFMTIAKMRAARRLVWRLADACGAGDAAGHMHLTSVSAWRMLARRDPWTNIMRTTLACAGAALGGASAIVLLPFTYALGVTDPFARRIARNIQIILQEEASLGRVADPAGGSWYVESLTQNLAMKAWDVFQAIEARGGMAQALLSGFVQDEIARVAETRRRDVVTGRIELTGVSAFPLLGDDGVKTAPWPPASPSHDSPAVTAARLRMARLAEPFERLRDAADAHEKATGVRPRVFLANLGTVADYGARSTWMRNILASGGIHAIGEDGYARSGDAAAGLAASDAHVACIVSSDAVYAELGEAAAQALKGAGASHVMLAGHPGDLEADLRSAGVDAFWYFGQDRIAMLTELHGVLGINPAQ